MRHRVEMTEATDMRKLFRGVMHERCVPACTKLQLVKATAHHLRNVQRQPERIRKRYQHDPVRYAT